MRISDWSSDVCSSDLVLHILADQRDLRAVVGAIAGGLNGIGFLGHLISLVLKVCWGRNVRACRSARLAGAAGGGNAALEQRPFEYARKHAYVGCVTVSDSVDRKSTRLNSSH